MNLSEFAKKLGEKANFLWFCAIIFGITTVITALLNQLFTAIISVIYMSAYVFWALYEENKLRKKGKGS